MKKHHLAPYCVALTAGNCILPSLLGQFEQSIRRTWEGRPFPWRGDLTTAAQVALAMPMWFCVITALTVLVSAGLFSRRVSVSLLVQALAGIGILECAALFYFSWGIWSYVNCMRPIG